MRKAALIREKLPVLPEKCGNVRKGAGRMKKTALILVFLCIVTAFSGCRKPMPRGGENEDKIKIVCTVFPIYDWVNSIIGADSGRFSVSLLGGGADLHSYQPTVEDIINIRTCDLFLYVGGSSDSWVRKIADGDGKMISLFEILHDDLLAERPSAVHDEHAHEHAHGHEHDEDGAYDEHVWLSLRNARGAVAAIAEEICGQDAQNAAAYRLNAKKYESELEMLDSEYENAVSAFSDKTVDLADRFPFLYLTEDYGIECFAAFPGCSADSEASFETVAYLSDKVARLGKRTVLVLENSKQNIAEAVLKNAGVSGSAAVMNSCQSVTRADIENGANYIDIMKANLKPLTAALGSDSEEQGDRK